MSSNNRRWVRASDEKQRPATLVSEKNVISEQHSKTTPYVWDSPFCMACCEDVSDREAWKWEIRRKIWDMLEREDIARFPRPVTNRIPNFVNAELAARNVASLDVFQSAQSVKVNPDMPQKAVRIAVLEHKKLLYVPQPRLRTGFISLLHHLDIPHQQIPFASTSEGAKRYGWPISLQETLDYRLKLIGKAGSHDESNSALKGKIDLVVVGSVAVDAKSGKRIGKGEGFADLEYAILRMTGLISEITPVVTCVHDSQIVDLSSDKHVMSPYDVFCDYVCTPTKVYKCNRESEKRPNPEGICWALLSAKKLNQVPVLQQLKRYIEKDLGRSLPGPKE